MFANITTGLRIFTISAIVVLTAACAATKPFHDYARAGDSIAIPVGKQADFKRDNLTVTITPSSGAPIVLSGTDPAIRAIVNFYPDPVSSMIVSKDIGENLTPFAQDYFNTTNVSAGSDRDWFQTTVFLDLPSSLPTGTTQIEISNTAGISQNSTLNIIPGTGTANSFSSDLGLDLNQDMLNSLSRVNNTTIEISSSSIPAAVELNFTHDPDSTVGGTGKYTVINPSSNVKNLQWSDDGTHLRVVMLQAHPGSISSVNEYKFYIAGTANNLQLSSISGYDASGTQIAGVTASLSQH